MQATESQPKQLTLSFPIPPTLNVQIAEARANKFKAARTKQEWLHEIGIMTRLESKGVKFKGKVWLAFCWKVHNFNSDPDNIAAAAKFLMDGLVAASLIVDDSLKYIGSPVIHCYQKQPKKLPEEVVITLSETMIYFNGGLVI